MATVRSTLPDIDAEKVLVRASVRLPVTVGILKKNIRLKVSEVLLPFLK